MCLSWYYRRGDLLVVSCVADLPVRRKVGSMDGGGLIEETRDRRWKTR